MITINALRKIATEFDNTNDTSDDEKLIGLFDKIFKNADENREITINELIQFFNSGIGRKIHTPINSENYK